MTLMVSLGTYVTTGQLIPGIFLMENKNRQNRIDPQKISTEKLNGRFSHLGVIALIGAYMSKGQIIPGIE